jgi:hypothetical protein
VTGGNLLTGGLISATGNVTGGNLSGTSIVGTLTTAAQTNITSVGTLSSVSVTGNVQGGNLTTAGAINSASMTATGTVLWGSAASRTQTKDDAGSQASKSGFFETASPVNYYTGANSWQHMLEARHSNDANNYALQIAGSFFDQILYFRKTNGSGTTAWSKFAVEATTPAFAGITNSGANGVGNIGSSTTYFNTVFAKATSAQYADVAEKYRADNFYMPGTVLEIGGSAEVTATRDYASTRIAGVVSTNPAFIMNSSETSENSVELALLGRIPCRVVGKIERGDMLCSSRVAGVATALPVDLYKPGAVIGKALESYDSVIEGVIEILVGRL